MSNGLGGFPFDVRGEITAVAAPCGSGPAFAIPLVTFSRNANSTYVQEVDHRGRVKGLSVFTAPGEYVVPLEDVREGPEYGEEELHAVIDPEGRAHVGRQGELSEEIGRWIDAVPWPLTRLTFADFAGDRERAFSAASQLLDQKKAERGGEAAARWFANAVILRRVQRAALARARSEEARLAIEADLEKVVMEVGPKGISAHVPTTLLDVLETPPTGDDDELAVARLLSGVVTPMGIIIEGWDDPLLEAPRGAGFRRGERPPTAELPGGPAHEVYAYLSKNLGAKNWVAKWRGAWRSSQFHPDFEDLAHQHLKTIPHAERAHREILEELLRSERPAVSPGSLRVAEDWLLRTELTTPGWGRIWTSYSARQAPSRELLMSAIDYLGEVRGVPSLGYSDWLRVWLELNRRGAAPEPSLNDIAVEAIWEYGNVSRFMRRVIAPLWGEELTPAQKQKVEDWFSSTPKRGAGWGQLYVTRLREQADAALVERGLKWLAEARCTGKQWGPVWLALHELSPSERLLRIGIVALESAKPNHKHLRQVWQSVAQEVPDSTVEDLLRRGWWRPRPIKA